MHVLQVSKEEWRSFAFDAHKAIFNELRSPDQDRIDFALLVGTGENVVGYVTCRETAADSVYWQFGGAVDQVRGTPKTFRAYLAFVEWTRERYKKISTFVESENVAYLKMAMKVGFRIVGTKNFHGKVLVDLLLEFDHAV